MLRVLSKCMGPCHASKESYGAVSGRMLGDRQGKKKRNSEVDSILGTALGFSPACPVLVLHPASSKL